MPVRFAFVVEKPLPDLPAHPGDLLEIRLGESPNVFIFRERQIPEGILYGQLLGYLNEDAIEPITLLKPDVASCLRDAVGGAPAAGGSPARPARRSCPGPTLRRLK